MSVASTFQTLLSYPTGFMMNLLPESSPVSSQYTPNSGIQTSQMFVALLYPEQIFPFSLFATTSRRSAKNFFYGSHLNTVFNIINGKLAVKLFLANTLIARAVVSIMILIPSPMTNGSRLSILSSPSSHRPSSLSTFLFLDDNTFSYLLSITLAVSINLVGSLCEVLLYACLMCTKTCL